jgi:hypothetical protein
VRVGDYVRVVDSASSVFGFSPVVSIDSRVKMGIYAPVSSHTLITRIMNCCRR